jgi:hypothetical protein
MHCADLYELRKVHEIKRNLQRETCEPCSRSKNRCLTWLDSILVPKAKMKENNDDITKTPNSAEEIAQTEIPRYG